MKNIFFIICSLFVLYSCAKKKIEIPPGVLSKEQMVPVLVDVHIAQAAAGLYNASDSTRYNMNDYLPYILNIHHVNRDEYDISISYYISHPEAMQEIYDVVITELSKKQSEVTAH